MISIKYGVRRLNTFFLAIRDNSGPNKGTQIGWVENLPKILDIKPIQKYLTLKYYGDIDLAKKAAIEYREVTLNNWLNKFSPAQNKNF